MPPSLTFVEAASMPLVALTAWDCLVRFADLRAGERVFVQAGSGGVGTMAIQLAAHLGAAEIATTCSERNHPLVRELGATRCIDYRSQRYDDALSDMDVALESLGGEHFARTRRILRRGGRLASINSNIATRSKHSGPWRGTLSAVASLLWDHGTARLHGVRSAPVLRKPDGEVLGRLSELVEGGTLKPVIDRVFPLDEMADAHAAVESGRTRGKVAIDVFRGHERHDPG